MTVSSPPLAWIVSLPPKPLMSSCRGVPLISSAASVPRHSPPEQLMLAARATPPKESNARIVVNRKSVLRLTFILPLRWVRNGCSVTARHRGTYPPTSTFISSGCPPDFGELRQDEVRRISLLRR